MSYIRKGFNEVVLDVSSTMLHDRLKDESFPIIENYITSKNSGPLFLIEGSKIKEAYGDYILEYKDGKAFNLNGEEVCYIQDSLIISSSQSLFYQIVGDLSFFELMAVIAYLFNE